MGPLGGCRKDGAASSSPVAALLPADTAAKLSPSLLTFAEELPAEIDAFGYLDFGKSLDQLTGDKQAFADYRLLYTDLTEMVKRRFGVELHKLSGLGFVVFHQQPLLVAAVPSRAAQTGEAANDVMLGQLGKLTVLGEPAAVTALLAAGKQGKRLYKGNAAWLRSAMSRAAGNAAFATVNLEKLMASAPLSAKAMLGEVLTGTLAIGATGAVAAATCKPGGAGKVQLMVEQGLTMAKGLVEAQGASLAQDPDTVVLAVLLRHYSGALWKSIEQKTSGDEVVVRLGWHAPELPDLKPVAISERVVTPGEIGVAQLNFGAPVLDVIIAVSDLLKAPLDRAALKKELSAELARLTGVPGLDPRALTVSASASGVIVSAHNAQVAPTGSPLSLANGAVAAVGTPWGLAFSPTSPTDPQLVTDALAKPDKGLPVAGVKLLAEKANVFRGYVDLTKLQPLLPPQLLSDLPFDLFGMLHGAAFSASASRFDAELTAAPGKAKALQAALAKATDELVPPEAIEMYKNRAKGTTFEELLGITSNFQRQSIKRYLTPTAVQGDKLMFGTEMSQPQMQMMAAAALVGIGAAVAIPAFMTYQLRGANRMGAGGLDSDLGGGAGLDAKTQEQLEQEMKEQMERIEQEMKELEAADGAPAKPMTPEEIDREMEKMKREMESMEKATKATGDEPARQP